MNIAIARASVGRQRMWGDRMGGTERTDERGVVLWINGRVSCRCLMQPDSQVEIRLVVAGVVVHREFFTDAEAASDYAIDKMHAYAAF